MARREEQRAQADVIPLPSAERTVADRRQEAKLKGYVGEACPECNNFPVKSNIFIDIGDFRRSSKRTVSPSRAGFGKTPK